ncbi:Crp/Fnr family transcriptional regulator [Mucilaginibacter sp.]|jgi:CRP-like cAMP-binding protein|uniref:Crp/Fnr family transcriptional regulator n=1 Tax=Mucilaginibacter sp. TaxID=1882438 RepID=UPI002C0B5202|nr:Crp/Fnr family transcriptional regulator [Mucilaginibacter sp.]HTI60808.1 Crp/Fnr family transcriptional regulator [Mucilaginibacter sp.]
MLFHFRDQFSRLNPFLDKYLEFQQKLEVKTKTLLLEEGKVSQNYIFIEKGCVRLFFNNNGDDKTVQFFFENEGLTSFESFVNDSPSQFTIETIEPSVVWLLPKQYVTRLLDELSDEQDFVQMILQISAKRQTHYINEFVSFIRDTPEERYQKLLSERPHIVRRVPQHYIASYLGVSTVHLSRIKSKLAKGKSHF